MRKNWLWTGSIIVLLAACTIETQEPQQHAPVQQVWNGPVEEISGAEPRYEAYYPVINQDYSVDGEIYQIVKTPQNFSETGKAAWYGEEANGSVTSTGELFDPGALTAAHPVLPIPSYVRVTNLTNLRKVVVRLNDRGPYSMPRRVIGLSKAAADRLNISDNTKVKIDFINVAPDGSVSGPGTMGTIVAKQSYALPDRPDLRRGTTSVQVLQDEAAVTPMADTTRSASNAVAAPNAPSTEITRATVETITPVPTVMATRYMLQIGALQDELRAQSWQQSISQRFGVAGRISTQGNSHRVQLGPFSSRQQAAELQQRLLNEAQMPSFITTTPPG